MNTGFSIKVNRNGKEQALIVKDSALTFGSSYKNSLPLQVGIESFKVAETKDAALSLYLRNDMEIKIYREGRVYDLDELRHILSSAAFIKLKKDVEVKAAFQDVEFSFKVVELSPETPQKMPKEFREHLVTKENAKFSVLLFAIAGLLFSFVLSATDYAAKMPKYAVLPAAEEEGKLSEPLQITYRELVKEKKRTNDKEEGKDAKIDKITAGSTKTASPDKVAKGTFFEGPAVLSTGILGVQEGAKTVVIKREKSLFGKLDEALSSVPVKASGEVSGHALSVKELEEQAKKGFTAAKAEDIYTGPVKKDVKTELEATERLKAAAKSAEVKILTGKRPETEILSVMGRYKKGFEFLFIEERKKDGGLKGRAVVYFVISSSGAVTHAEISDTDIGNREFLEKILVLFKSIKFPQSEHGDTGVKLPLIFFPS